MKMTDERLREWLQTGTDDDLLHLARFIERELTRRVQAADSHGDGPLVNAICAAARTVFVANLVW
jgi:dTDP-glucose pyrophosphorylase